MTCTPSRRSARRRGSSRSPGPRQASTAGTNRRDAAPSCRRPPPMTAADDRHLHLAVSLDGAGWHPAAWRDPSARPTELFTARYWVDQARTAERGLLDFISFDDSFGIQSGSLRRIDDRTDQVRGRMDASLVASLVAPATQHIGLLPTVTTTYPEPFHIASAISTLDYVSKGRGGWQARVSGRAEDAALVGVRPAPDVDHALPRPVRRGHRRRRGRPPAVGQLGGRRHHQGRRHRPLRRPRQAALRRLRGPLLHRQGPLDRAPPAAGPADRRRPRPPAGAVRVRRHVGRRRVRHAGRHRRRPALDRRRPGCRGDGRSRRPAAAAVRRPRRVPRRHPRRRRGPPGRARRPRRRSSTARTAPCSSARPTSWPTSCWPGATSGSRASGSARR